MREEMSGKKRFRLALTELLTFILFLLFLVPFFMVLLNSAKTSQEIILSPLSWPKNVSQIFSNISNIFNHPSINYFKAFLNSSFITVVSLIIIIVFSSMAAWVIVRRKGKLSNFIYIMFLCAMVIPFQVVMFPLVQWFKLLSDNTPFTFSATYFGIFFAYLGFGCPLSIFILVGFIKNIPLSLEEAATIDGCSQPRIFFSVVVPLLKPITVTVLILNGIWIWNDFLLPVLILGGTSGKIQTMPLAVTAFAGAYVKQWDLILTSTLLAMLPIVILFIFAQRYIMKGMVDGAVK